MRNKFDMQLDSLKEQLTTMGELCEVAITKATEAILEGKEEQAREVILADEEIDQAEYERRKAEMSPFNPALLN